MKTTLLGKIVLVDAEKIRRGPYGKSLEACVIKELLDRDIIKIGFPNGDTSYWNTRVINAIIRDADDNECSSWGLKKPAQSVYKTGTYVMRRETGLNLVEVDRVEETYYIHDVDNQHATVLTDEIWRDLSKLDDVDDQKSDAIDPGMYCVDTKMVEVIRFNGQNCYRTVGSSMISEIPKHMVETMKRVECDTIDVNSIMVIQD